MTDAVAARRCVDADVGRPAVDAIAVVVPAHDESATIDPCLDALEAAAQHRDLAGIPVAVIVVLDRCRDDTGVRAGTPRSLPVRTITVNHRNVGRARRAGFAHVIRERNGAHQALWLASTDADTTVPRDWFARQMAWRASGFDALAGTVRVEDWAGHSDTSRLRFEAHQARVGVGDGHGHVHGANLSFTADAYLAVGGIPACGLAEDHALWGRMRSAGLRTFAVGDLAVTTSARRTGRAPGGFSAFVRSLAGDERNGGARVGLEP